MHRELWRRFLSTSTSAKKEDGQAIVELAVSITLLFFILLGAVEFARFAYTAIEVSDAAKAAAQAAAMNAGQFSDSGGVTNAGKYDAPDLGTTVTSTVTATNCYCTSNEPTGFCPNADPNYVACTSSCASGRLMKCVEVQTSATYTPLFTAQGFGGRLFGTQSLVPSGGVTVKGYAKQQELQ